MNGFLLIGRCGSDDVPLYLADNMKSILDFAGTMDAQFIIDAVWRVYEADASSVIVLAMVEFRDGLPQPATILDQFDVEAIIDWTDDPD